MKKLSEPSPKTLETPLPGSICREWRRCGKRKCKCASGELHGPYFYRFWWTGGRRRKTYVRLAEVERCRDACAVYRRRREKRREDRAFLREHVLKLRELNQLLKMIERVHHGR